MQFRHQPGDAPPASQIGRVHRVTAVDFLTEQTYRLSIERSDFTFRAGQCANLGCAGSGLNREYSTYSAETAAALSFLIRRVDGGVVSEGLAALRPGDPLELDGPYGEFCLADPGDGRRYVFVASGTGIAPFHSYVLSYPGLDYQVLHGVRQAEECYDRADYAPERYVACITQGGGGDFSGRVTDYLRARDIDREAVYYLCGNRMMINEVYDLLREQRVPGSQIFTETFF